MLLQEAASAATHPLANTAASWLWLIPLLPLAGFVINGLLSLTAAFHAGPSDPTIAGHGDSHEHPTTDASLHSGHGENVRHKYAAITSIVGPLVLLASFGVAVAVFLA